MPTGLVTKLLAVLAGVMLGKVVLDSARSTPSVAPTAAQPVVVNVHKKYVTRGPRPRKRTKKVADDTQNLEVVATQSPPAGGAAETPPDPSAELPAGDTNNSETE